MTAKRLFFALGVGCIICTGTARPAEEPKRGEEKEQELQDAQVALALARVRQARVEGKSEVVIAECRKLLKHHEADLKAVCELGTRGRLCSEVPLREAEGAVAVARAWLAEAENKREALAAELPKVISYYEWRIKQSKSEYESGVISKQDLEWDVKVSETELKWAKGRLAGLRIGASKPDKSGTSGKT